MQEPRLRSRSAAKVLMGNRRHVQVQLLGEVVRITEKQRSAIKKTGAFTSQRVVRASTCGPINHSPLQSAASGTRPAPVHSSRGDAKPSKRVLKDRSAAV